MILPVARHVLRAYELGWFTPNRTLAPRRTNDIFLVVCSPENDVTAQSYHQDPHHLRGRQVHWIPSQILRLDRVQARHNHHRSKTQVIPEMIMRHVDGAKVPALIPEKIEHVDEVEQVDQPHRIRHPPQFLILVRGVRDGNQRPRDDPRPPIVEELEVPEFPEARVQFYTHEVVEDDGTAELAVVRVRGRVVRLHLREHGEGQPVDCRGDQEARPVLGDHGQIDDIEVSQRQKEDVRQDPRAQAVGAVDEQVAGGCHLPL